MTITNERITLTADTDAGSAPTIILDNVTGATSGTDNDLNYITNNDAGLMQLELSAANVNRLGRLMLTITDAANHVPVFHEFMVLPAVIYDTFILGTDTFDVNITALANDVITAASINTGALTADAFAADALVAATFATNSITADAIAADAVTEIQTGLALAADLSTDAEIADAVWDEVVNSGHAVANSAAVDLVAILADTNELQVDDYPTSIAAVKSDTAAILTDTGTTLDTLIKDIPTVAEFEARTIAAATYATAAALDTIDNFLDTEIAAILEDTGTTP